MDKPFDLSEVFCNIRQMVSLFEPGYERTNAVTRINEAEMWLSKCELKKPVADPSAESSAVTDVLGFTAKIGVILSPAEFIDILSTYRNWEVISNFGGRLIVYVKDGTPKDGIYFGPNPLEMDAGQSMIFLDQVRRLQRRNNQVT